MLLRHATKRRKKGAATTDAMPLESARTPHLTRLRLNELHVIANARSFGQAVHPRAAAARFSGARLGA
jgi:hypothetical protein